MFDVYKYIESKDEREYLKKIGYKFNTPLSAWIVWRNHGLSMEERHNGFRQIIENLPDCPIEERLNFKAEKSLHAKLRKMMEEEKNIICEMERNAYKEYSFSIFKNGRYQKDARKYNDFKACLSDAKEEVQKNGEEISISATNGAKYDIVRHLHISKDGNPLSVDFIENSLFGLWFDLPMPFKKGDIVRFVSDDTFPVENRFGPIVITSVPENKEDNKSLDTFDMTFQGAYIDSEGNLFEEAYFLCTEVEFFKDKLTKEQEKLQILSEKIKNFA